MHDHPLHAKQPGDRADGDTWQLPMLIDIDQSAPSAAPVTQEKGCASSAQEKTTRRGLNLRIVARRAAQTDEGTGETRRVDAVFQSGSCRPAVFSLLCCLFGSV